MVRDVSLYVRVYSVCAKSKFAGKLVPLPIPHRPWSHVGVDFVIDLPNSEGFTCILVAVERFSKACRLIPLKGLPTALETAEALFYHVFRNYGIPEDIVSDRGSQFISHVWKALSFLGISMVNGQTKQKIQEIGRYLQAYNQHSWNRFLPWALERRTLQRSRCGPLVLSEWESLGISPCSPPAGSAETQGIRGCPSVLHPRLLPRR